MNMIQQESWNDKNKTGSFSGNAKNPEKTISLKFNAFECGGLIYAIDSLGEFSAFHTFEKDKTQITFKPWQKAAATDEKAAIMAFGFSVTKNTDQKFKISIEMGEAVVLREYLRRALQKHFQIDEQKKENSNSQ
jgi:hypothetical protein